MTSGSRLTPKIQRQLNASTNTPPSGGPITKAVPVHAVHAEDLDVPGVEALPGDAQSENPGVTQPDAH